MYHHHLLMHHPLQAVVWVIHHHPLQAVVWVIHHHLQQIVVWDMEEKKEKEGVVCAEVIFQQTHQQLV
jgi:hypothetical protein